MSVPVPVDPAESQRWNEIAIGTRLYTHVLGNVGDPAEGSNFDKVAQIFPFERVADRARSYLSAAQEHLMFWADYMAPLKFHPEQTTNVTLRPGLTLARAALESSSQAVWMIDVREPLECVRRHISLMRWDLEEHRKSKLDLAEKATVRKREEDLVERVSQVFTSEQVSSPGSYLTVIRGACESPDLSLEVDEAERVWRRASGAAHGKYWPTMDMQTTFVGEEYDEGQYRSIQIPDPSAITEVLDASHRMCEYGVLRFADYAGADIGALLEQARLWVFENLPIKADADPEALKRLARTTDPT